ncbi:DNA damage-binding protein 2 [Halotydeus destructor]|nr:DNA damage-binding protein 2 [Halotydeus destructor]
MFLPDSDKIAGPKNVQTLDSSRPTGGLTRIRFDPVQNDVYFTTSISGKVSRGTLDSKVNRNIFQTYCPGGKMFDHWFTVLDVHPWNKMLYVGDNRGNLHIMPQNSGKDFDFHCLHKSDIHCVDIHPRNHNILATSSADYSVKIWEIIKLKVESPLEILNFEVVINSGFFSRQDGVTFVSLSSQKNSFRYSVQLIGNDCILLIVLLMFSGISHPSKLLGTWYQEGKQEYSCAINFFDAESGEHIHQIESIDHVGIKSLNVFNCSGIHSPQRREGE